MRLIGLAVVVALGLTLTPIVSEAQKPWQEFGDHGDAYATLVRDLHAMTKGTNDYLEIAIGRALLAVASDAQALCHSAGELAIMRGLVRAGQDRKDVDQFFRLVLGQRAEQINDLVERANDGLVRTNSPGMVATAIRLRDQLRSSKALLERSRLPE